MGFAYLVYSQTPYFLHSNQDIRSHYVTNINIAHLARQCTVCHCIEILYGDIITSHVYMPSKNCYVVEVKLHVTCKQFLRTSNRFLRILL